MITNCPVRRIIQHMYIPQAWLHIAPLTIPVHGMQCAHAQRIQTVLCAGGAHASGGIHSSAMLGSALQLHILMGRNRNPCLDVNCYSFTPSKINLHMAITSRL
jgi:hypothetical protein